LGRNGVVVSLLDNAQEFQRFQAGDAHRIGGGLGFDIEVVFAANSTHLQTLQISQVLERAGEARPLAIVTETVAGGGLEPLAREAARRGIGWILINRRASYMEGLRRAYPALPVATVSGDQLEIGRLQARQLLSVLPPRGGRVLYIQGPADTSAAQDRLAGLRAVLATDSADVRLAIARGDWTEASGETVAASWLASRRARWRRWLRAESWLPDAVVCQNDLMALGARRAVLEAGLSLPLFGVDGLVEGGQKQVEDGHMTATVIVPPNTGPAIHLVAKKLLQNEPIPEALLMSPLSYPRLATLAERARREAGATTH
jgi:ABC-type sugar transport system substrate-binding protein